MTHSTQLGLHVDEILDNNLSVYASQKQLIQSYAQGTWLTPILHVAPLPKHYSIHLLILQAMQATQLVESCLAVNQLFGGELNENLHHRQY